MLQGLLLRSVPHSLARSTPRLHVPRLFRGIEGRKKKADVRTYSHLLARGTRDVRGCLAKIRLVTTGRSMTAPAGVRSWRQLPRPRISGVPPIPQMRGCVLLSNNVEQAQARMR